MNPELVKVKLEQLARCLDRIRDKTAVTQAQFLKDLDLQDITMKNLERAVQVCVDVANHLVVDQHQIPPPSSMNMAMRSLATMGVIPDKLAQNMENLITLRNRAVHEYQTIDYGLIFESVKNGLSVFEEYARSVLIYVKGSAS